MLRSRCFSVSPSNTLFVHTRPTPKTQFVSETRIALWRLRKTTCTARLYTRVRVWVPKIMTGKSTRPRRRRRIRGRHGARDDERGAYVYDREISARRVQIAQHRRAAVARERGHHALYKA